MAQLGGTTDRRSFLQLLGLSGLAIGGAASLTACGSDASSEGDTWNKTLAFVGWDYEPDKIKEFTATWGKTKDVKVDVTIIPSLGFSAALQSRLRGGARADVFYNFAYASQKFVKDKFAATLEGRSNVDDILNDMFEASRSRYVDADQRLISLPYFSAVDMNVYNKAMLAKAGISAPPSSLQDYYTQSKAVKEAGASETPFLGFWNKDVLEHYLITYLLLAGVTPFDEGGEPAFADDPATVDVLAWWQTMYQEGLVQKSALTDDPGKLITTMSSGKAAFWIVDHYVMKNLVEAKGSASQDLVMVQPTSGTKTLQFGEVIQMGAKTSGKAADAAWELMKYYGWKDPNGQFATFRAWAKSANLLAPYPGVFADPEVRAAFGDYMNLPLIQQTFESGSELVPARTRSWYSAFAAQAGDVLQQLIVGKLEPSAAKGELAKAVSSAKSGGGL
ncbi:MAG: carbohydrate ABC transporter substrate-binding protein [Nocardioidaceae bacterium]|nr:carbohydrate ABC transporter substrate-binding protein [Nocardioidaceae bacterium]